MDATSPEREAEVLTGLAAAVAGAVRAGAAELDRLAKVVAEAERRLGKAARGLRKDGGEADQEANGFAFLLDEAVGDLSERLDRSREKISTFNIVFFGRTGAGKSTLLSALGQLDGELVSDGHSDFTTEVHPLAWAGCQLYDTPGINGWGRTQSRADLEAKARAAVETADVVLLCFDSQSQQAAEFAKVAAWVKEYGKPVLAVLNVRNTMWRDPVRVLTPQHREQLTETVRQHAANIGDELEAIGLAGVPLVALNSKRGLFARATTPFHGPAVVELETLRERHGVDLLDSWSNLPVLEALLTAYVTEGASDLRIAAVREVLRAEFRAWADQFDLFLTGQEERSKAVERTIAEWLAVLGYPDPKNHLSKLVFAASFPAMLGRLEELIGEPFGASVKGRLEHHCRQVLRAELGAERALSIRRAQDLIAMAFNGSRDVSEDEFEGAVFDRDAIAQGIEKAAGSALDFLKDSLELAGTEGRLDLSLVATFEERIHESASFNGAAGANGRLAGSLLRACGLAASGASAVLGVVALTQFWNPAGWIAAAVIGGLSIGSAVSSFFGGRARAKAEQSRVKARAEALAGARDAVNSTFDKYEKSQLQTMLKEAGAVVAEPLSGLISSAFAGRQGMDRLRGAADWLRQTSNGQPASVSPEIVIERALARLDGRVGESQLRSVRALLLGEDWLPVWRADEAGDGLSYVEISELVRASDESAERLRTFLGQLGEGQSGRDTVGWLRTADDSSMVDEAAMEESRQVQQLLFARPRVVVLGDFSAGKTSLIKRLLAEVGAPTPENLAVDARPVTATVETYRFGELDLVDAPGFQSSHDEHDTLALDAADGAGVVIIVLHVNLLIGDLSRLVGLLRGTADHVGKIERTIFVIGRIDELGVDPHTAPSELTARRRLKEKELAHALSTHGIEVAPGQILTVAADPFGMVAGRTPVTRDDYRDRDRTWDGISTLVDAMIGIDAQARADLAAGAAADCLSGAFMRARNRVSEQIERWQIEHRTATRVEALLGTSLQELDLIISSAKRQLGRIVTDHATEVMTEALAAKTDNEIGVMADHLESWWQDPRLDKALAAGLHGAADDFEDWATRSASDISREWAREQLRLSAAGLDAEAPTIRTDNHRAGRRFMSSLLSNSAHMVSAAGSRDAVYQIVKSLGGKFKPWGAVKLGARVAKAGAVLGVVAVGFDAYSWVKDLKAEGNRDSAREQALKHIQETIPQVIDRFTDEGPGTGGKDGEGTFFGHVAQVRRDLGNEIVDVKKAASESGEAIAAAQTKLQQITELIELREATE